MAQNETFLIDARSHKHQDRPRVEAAFGILGMDPVNRDIRKTPEESLQSIEGLFNDRAGHESGFPSAVSRPPSGNLAQV